MIPFDTGIKIQKIKFRIKNTYLGASWVPLWGRFGTLLGSFWVPFGASWALLGPLGALLGFPWALLEGPSRLFQRFWAPLKNATPIAVWPLGQPLEVPFGLPGDSMGSFCGFIGCS